MITSLLISFLQAQRGFRIGGGLRRIHEANQNQNLRGGTKHCKVVSIFIHRVGALGLMRANLGHPFLEHLEVAHMGFTELFEYVG